MGQDLLQGSEVCARITGAVAASGEGVQQRERAGLEHLLLRALLVKNVVEHKSEVLAVVPPGSSGLSSTTGWFGTCRTGGAARPWGLGGLRQHHGHGALLGWEVCTPTGTWGWDMGLLGDTAPDPMIWVLVRSGGE